jgi:transglutaminase-like putative cysteine protease
VKREYLTEGTGGASDWPVPPGSAFYVVRLAGRQVGIASTTVDTVAEGLKVTQWLRIDLPTPDDTARRVLTRIDALLARNLRLRTWHSDVIENNVTASSGGRVEGDSVLTLEGKDTIRVPVARPPVPSVAIPFRIVFAHDLKVGRSLDIPLFDPIDWSLGSQHVSVAAESTFVVPDSAQFDSVEGHWVVAHLDTVKAWRLDALEHGLPVHRWIDAQGLVIEASTPLGLTLERSAFEIVDENYRRGRRRARRLPAGTALLPRAEAESKRLDTLVSRITAPSPLGISAPLPAFEGGGQRFEGDSITTFRWEPDLTTSGERSQPDSALREALVADARIDHRDPAIQAAAARVIDTDRAPAAMVQRLTQWVARSIPLERDGIALASASHTLETARGDAKAHAALFVALARAVGIPARLVAGVLKSGDTFHYYSWAEVNLGAWVPVDPTEGRFPADVTHIRLATGSAGRAADLVPFVGQVRLEVVREVPLRTVSGER